MRKRDPSGPILNPEPGRGEGCGQLSPRNGLKSKIEVEWFCNVTLVLNLPLSLVMTYIEASEAPL